MSVLKIENNNCNDYLKDKNLSFKAKGLLSFILSLFNDSNCSLEKLTSVSKEGNGFMSSFY